MSVYASHDGCTYDISHVHSVTVRGKTKGLTTCQTSCPLFLGLGPGVPSLMPSIACSFRSTTRRPCLTTDASVLTGSGRPQAKLFHYRQPYTLRNCAQVYTLYSCTLQHSGSDEARSHSACGTPRSTAGYSSGIFRGK